MARKYTGHSGHHDQGAKLQAWLDAGGGALPAGVYLSGRQLLFPKGCVIEGAHPSLSVIATHPSYRTAPGLGFFVNREQMHEGVPVTQGVRFSGFSIRGSGSLRETEVGLGLIGVTDSSFIDVGISGFRWLVTPANCTRLLFDRLEGSEWGCAVQDTDAGNINCEGGTAFLGHSAFPNTHLELRDCHFHDGKWTALDTGLDGLTKDWKIIRLTIRRVMEAGLFGRLTDSLVQDAVIEEVRIRAVSAHAFEGGMDNSEWRGGSLSNLDGDAFLLLSTMPGTVIRNVGVFNTYMKKAGADSAIAFRGTANGVLVEDCYGADYLNSGAAPIGFYADQPMNNILVRGRNFWNWNNIVKEVGDCRGENFVIED